MLDFILCRDADPKVCGAIGVGLRTGAERAGIEIPGGEIAQVGEIVSGWELGGSAIGLVQLDAIVDGGRAEAGDAIIGLPSSGLHSNGYTLARRALAEVPLSDERLGRPLGEILLQPTEIYVPAVLELLGSAVDVRGLAHITGDGLNNLTRLAAPVGYEITDPLDMPPVFGLIAELGEVPENEMYEVFNMGCGFVCVIAAADRDAALALLRGHYPAAKPIGVVTDRAGAVERR
jgi:phosphoribosylformylglycinamidine cyclo-ligase